MLTKRLTALAVGASALFALSMMFSLNRSYAQGQTIPDQPPVQGRGNPPQGGFRPGDPGQGGPGQPGQMRPGQMMGMGGGGGAAMVDDNFFLYVLQGNMVFKVNKSDLKVTGQAMLGMPGGPGQPGFRPGGGPPPDGGAGPIPPEGDAPVR